MVGQSTAEMPAGPPLMLLDVDGVLNPSAPTCPPAYTEHESSPAKNRYGCAPVTDHGYRNPAAERIRPRARA